MQTVRELREQRGWSQEKLAREADVSTATVRVVEAGRANPRLETLRALARALGVSLDELVGEREAV